MDRCVLTGEESLGSPVGVGPQIVNYYRDWGTGVVRRETPRDSLSYEMPLEQFLPTSVLLSGRGVWSLSGISDFPEFLFVLFTEIKTKRKVFLRQYRGLFTSTERGS